ncbi:sulfur carrier protein ThiS [Desulfovibrio desulfuricans]|uniref:sulfur carrier protein ThiS n=1 Tax=Desulfovibrio desulfuricans TaxID=876 RepID=UPI0035B3FBBF
MEVTINGETESFAKPCSVADMLAARGHDAQRVVVERNGRILPRELFSQTVLSQGDSLEIVHFVGGG